MALLEHFEDLEDPRTRCARHGLMELLLTAICAVLSGADNWAAVALWGRAKRDWLRKFLPFAHGVASHDTFGRVFALLNAAVFEQCFIGWMRPLCGAFDGLHVALDGKTVRRSQLAGQKAIHVVAAFAHGLGLTLGQVKTAEKSNEIMAIPELLEALLLKGCLVTIDAMGCQKAIAAKIIQQESDYALLVKNNQPGLAAALHGARRSERREGPTQGLVGCQDVDLGRVYAGMRRGDQHRATRLPVFAADRHGVLGKSRVRALGHRERLAWVTGRRLWRRPGPNAPRQRRRELLGVATASADRRLPLWDVS